MEQKLDLSVLDKITIPEVETIDQFETKVEQENKVISSCNNTKIKISKVTCNA